MEYTTRYESPVGVLTMASDGEALTGLWLEGQKYFELGIEEHEEKDDLSIFDEARSWLDIYFEGKDPGKIPATNPRGTEFRKLVWKELERIPYGQLTTYGELKKRVELQTGGRSSARAVGGAVGHNPISILVPCHRVVGSNGSLTGYAGGIDRKIALLELEGVDVDKLKVPTRGTAL
ncbi:MAG: methylated-DNA--[protein]-cysteine S-methyltransferase [Coriobacteriales bacterium]